MTTLVEEGDDAKSQGLYQLEPYLFLSAHYPTKNASTLKKYHITTIINVSNASDQIPTASLCAEFNIVYRPIKDDAMVNIIPTVKSLSLFMHESLKASKADKKKEIFLVHCNAGQSRSVSVVLAFYISYCQMSLKDAYTKVKSVKSDIGPNIGFMSQLCELEKATLNCETSSFDMKCYKIELLSRTFSQMKEEDIVKILEENQWDLERSQEKIFSTFLEN
ncbi:hypothetical protein RFI_06132 [Reticulomyxa filosa]|uniref:protein-tyrosine-phosphatase n=1 Tax=Reticulomyxa filosa TaxID=46433 RepID=X6NYS5_RETFI|nr:hypothetical protein RFI_06132 [Reticulomyxa filosa]|eukprot:ETO30989.1 hypothetical protein RFI_06132 [Reticulomyxa filosa]